MGLTALTTSFPWYRYSKKLISKIDRLRSAGAFALEEAVARDVRLAEGYDGSIAEGNYVHLYWLVDKDDGVIIDARYKMYGQSALIGAAEAACELLIGKNYEQARRMTADLIDRQLRDKTDQPAFPREAFLHLNLVLGAIEMAADTCLDLPVATAYAAPPVPFGDAGAVAGGYPGWIDLPLKKKIAVIEEVLDQDVRPYIALDAGGVHVVNLIDDKEVIVTYSGSCTSCYSSVGTTLSYIQQTLRNKVHAGLNVIPDVEFQG